MAKRKGQAGVKITPEMQIAGEKAYIAWFAMCPGYYDPGGDPIGDMVKAVYRAMEQSRCGA